SERTARPLLIRTGAAALASQPVVSLAVIWAAAAIPQPTASVGPVPLWTVDASSCFRPDIYRAVAALPPGLVFGPLELGPRLAAFPAGGVGGRRLPRGRQGHLVGGRGEAGMGGGRPGALSRAPRPLRHAWRVFPRLSEPGLVLQRAADRIRGPMARAGAA